MKMLPTQQGCMQSGDQSTAGGILIPGEPQRFQGSQSTKWALSKEMTCTLGTPQSRPCPLRLWMCTFLPAHESCAGGNDVQKETKRKPTPFMILYVRILTRYTDWNQTESDPLHPILFLETERGHKGTTRNKGEESRIRSRNDSQTKCRPVKERKAYGADGPGTS